jgi:hypothetical protein
MKHLLILLVLQLTILFSLYSQAEPDYREMFLEAESYFLFEEYNEALPIYLRLNSAFPENDNYNYKIGVCYLNDPYQKDKAIDYLEKAIQNINQDYKDNSYKETAAPPEAYFYLGNAYRINNQIDKAIETYKLFKELSDPEVYDHELVDEQIKACNNAIELKNKPVDIDISNLGERINTRFSDINPVVSGDETKMVYIQEQQFYDAVFFSEKIDGNWSYPRLIIPELGVDEDAYPTGLSYDGSELLIYRSDNFIGDIYHSKLVDGFWTNLTKLNENINTKYWESHACYSRTGDTLYFTSNRKGGYGGLDIYISIKDQEGEWGVPINLGPVINSKYNEETPYITQDGKTLYFSSYGHYNIGGYDVLYSTLLDDNTWAVPINAGFPINTTDDDIFFNPVQNGNYAYFPRFIEEEGYGRTDIYKLEIYSSSHPRKFRIKGLASLPANLVITRPVTVKVIEKNSRDTIAVTNAHTETGEFTFEAPAGQYELLIEGEEIETTISTLIVPEYQADREIKIEKDIPLAISEELKESITPQIVDKIKLSDTLIFVNNDDPVNIRMNLEKDADLYINVYMDTSYLRTDSFHIERQRFTYSYTPQPGKNILKLKLVDKDSNLSFEEAAVIYTPPETTQITEPVQIDSISTTPVKEPVQEIPDENLLEFLDELKIIANGDLKTVLNELDLSKTDITSEKDLIQYLKEKSKSMDYSSQDVYDLHLKQLQTKYIQSYIDQLAELSEDENIKNSLLDIDPATENITSLQELYNHMVDNAGENTYRMEDVNQLFSILSQRTELLKLIGELTEIASGNLRHVLEELDPDQENLTNSVNLMDYLLTNAEKFNYGEADALSLLFDYLEDKDLDEIMKILIGTSSGALQDYLITLNLEANNISDIPGLYYWLLNQSKYHSYSELDVIDLFLNLLNIIDNQELIRKVEPPPPPPLPPARTKKVPAFVYLIGGAGLLIIIFIFYRRRKKKNKNREETSFIH